METIDFKKSIKDYMNKKEIRDSFKKKYPKRRLDTKFFKDYNRNLLRRGKTVHIAYDDNLVYNKTTDRFLNKKQKRSVYFTKAGTLREKFKKDFETSGDVIENIVVRKEETNKKYINKIFKQYKGTPDSKFKELTILKKKFDGKQYDVNKVVSLLQKLNQPGKRVVITDGTKHVTVRADTLRNIKDMLEDSANEEAIKDKSDYKMVYDIFSSGKSMKIIVRDRAKKPKSGGKFFPYTHKLDKVDLTRYGIFQSVEKENYENNCLCYSLEKAGYDIQPLKVLVKNQEIAMCKLKQVCELLNICITVNRVEDKKNIKKYGDKNNPIVKLGLIEGHYFLIEKTEYTRYSIENYFDVCELKDFNKIRRKQGNIYKREKRYIDSNDIIKILLENKKSYLEPITQSDELYKTVYNGKVPEVFKNLEYNEEENLKVNKSNVFNKEIEETYFFDFETSTSSEKKYDVVKGNINPYHTPYCVFTDKHKSGFWGVDCGKQLLQDITIKHGVEKGENIPTIRLIAHNSSYDYRFLINYLFGIKSIEKGKSLVVANALFRYNDLIVKLEIKDSLKMINMALKKFGETFNLEQDKEIMPYDLYTEENIKRKIIDKDICLSFVEEKDKEDYLINCEKVGCIKKDKIDILKYAGWYCYIDCIVLKQGYEKFNELVKEAIGSDINDYLTLASMSHDYLIKSGCYDDVLAISGVPRAFIQNCVVGGRTMLSENKKSRRDIDYADYDACSLYPSAMCRMDGFLKGKPKVIKNFEPEKYDGYFIRMRITKVGRNLKFPLASYKNKKGVRVFTNDLVGREIYIDKIALEDLVEFQKVEYEFLQGYYYDGGFNDKIKTVMKDLYENRKEFKNVVYVYEDKKHKKLIAEYKNEKLFNKSIHKNNSYWVKGNPIQLVFKELMNSSYGKSSLKPINDDCVYKHEKEIDDYVDRYFNYIKEYTRIANTKYFKVKVDKSINNHFNNVHIGVEILSMSKRIMNEVMVLAEDLEIDMRYQDTDSIHLPLKDVERLEEKFKKDYKRDLEGNNTGNFHVDFDMDGIKKGAKIKSIKSIFLGKKCYIDKLESIDKDDNKIYDYHIRLKGVSNDCIYYKAEQEYNGDVFRIFEDLYNKEYTGIGDKELNSFEGKGKGLQFNLTAVRPKFDMCKDMRIISRKDFYRNIYFD